MLQVAVIYMAFGCVKKKFFLCPPPSSQFVSEADYRGKEQASTECDH